MACAAVVHCRPRALSGCGARRVGRIPDGGGHKVLGRAAGRKTRSGAGHAYPHTAIDDYSRLAYSEIQAVERKETAAAGINLVPADDRPGPPAATHTGSPIFMAS